MLEEENDLLIGMQSPMKAVNPLVEQRRILSAKVQRWFTAEYFYSQVDRAYFQRNGFLERLESLGIAGKRFTTKEWALLRKLVFGSKRRIFSQRFVDRERERLLEFRAVFRDIMSLMDQRKELI